jgi:hypothetical protein
MGVDSAKLATVIPEQQTACVPECAIGNEGPLHTHPAAFPIHFFLQVSHPDLPHFSV